MVSPSRLAPSLPSLDEHTLAVGLEARVAGALVTVGLARSLSSRQAASGSGTTLVTPLGPSDLSVGAGTYDTAATLVAVGVDVEL
jgi:hypothetical protein